MFISRQKGQTVPFITFVIIIIFIITMFTVNLGRIGMHRVRTSIASDSGALSGGSYNNYALNSLVIQSRSIYISYVTGMALSQIPEKITCQNNAGACCAALAATPPPCASEIPLKTAIKLGKMLAFIAAQYVMIDMADAAAYKSFKTSRYQARQMAFSNAGADDLKKFTGAPDEFTTSDADLTELSRGISDRCRNLFVYRDEWQAAGRSFEDWQKAESRFSLWLDLWSERNQDDTKDEGAPAEGRADAFNSFGALDFRWDYPQRPGQNILSVNVEGDEFNGVVTAASPVFGSVMGICLWRIPIFLPFGRCICITIPTPIYIPLVLPGPEMFITGINDFASGPNPEITVSVARDEPEGRDVAVWKAKYPRVISSATAETSGGSVGMWGDDNYDTKIIDTK